MTPTWFFITCQFALIACALVAGVFLTFSDFVMRSLAGSKTVAGIEAMQVINRKVYRTLFMVLLLGMSLAWPLLMTYSGTHLEGSASDLILAGGGLYLIGVLGVTLVFNVPMNNRLDQMDHTSNDAAAYWQETYLPRWTRWNTVRTVASAGSAICLLLALVDLMALHG